MKYLQAYNLIVFSSHVQTPYLLKFEYCNLMSNFLNYYDIFLTTFNLFKMRYLNYQTNINPLTNIIFHAFSIDFNKVCIYLASNSK